MYTRTRLLVATLITLPALVIGGSAAIAAGNGAVTFTDHDSDIDEFRCLGETMGRSEGVAPWRGMCR